MPVNCDNDGAEALLESAPPPLNHGERTVRRGVAPPPHPYPQTQFLFTSSLFCSLSTKNIFHLFNYI